MKKLIKLIMNSWRSRRTKTGTRIANIALNDAMILPYDANPRRIRFSERTANNSRQVPRLASYS